MKINGINYRFPTDVKDFMYDLGMIPLNREGGLVYSDYYHDATIVYVLEGKDYYLDPYATFHPINRSDIAPENLIVKEIKIDSEPGG